MSPTIPLSYRIPRRLAEALDAFCEAHPGITRSTAITLLLHTALEQQGAIPPADSVTGTAVPKTDISELLSAEG